MPSPCRYLLESATATLLKSQGFRVHILPKTQRKNSFPLCVVAFGENGGIRTIRIKKALTKPRGQRDVEARYAHEIQIFRKRLARVPADPDQHYELWIYAEKTGFFCCEVLPDTLREIPAPVWERNGMLSFAPGCPLITSGAP